MSKRGLLVDYDWCTGCHSCEIACQMEHNLPPDQFGIKLATLGPWKYGEDSWQYTFVPLLTNQCDFCESRVAQGKKPTCVHHCQANCIKIVSLEEANQKMAEDDARRMFITA